MTVDEVRPKRDHYWDILRGIAILVVILIHTRPGSEYTDWNFNFWVIERSLINFPVALFVFIAGYFVSSNKVSEIRAWLLERAKRLGVPFLVWSAIYTIISIVQTGGVESLRRLVINFFFGLSAGHMYFLVMLAQLVVLTPLIVKASKTRLRLALFALTPAYLGIMYVYTIESGSLPAWYAHVFLGWFAFYYAGILFRQKPWKMPRVRVAVLFAAVAGAWSVLEAFVLLWLDFPTGLAISQLSFSSVTYAFTIILLLLAVKPRADSGPGKLLVCMGLQSYGIYFVHMVWIYLIGTLLGMIPAADGLPLFIVQLVQLVLTVLLSVASVWIARRILGPRFADRVLGF